LAARDVLYDPVMCSHSCPGISDLATVDPRPLEILESQLGEVAI
jgi:hypothetical protein